MNFNFKDKKILITGASGGIGKDLFKKFIDMGSRIIFTSSNADKLQQLKNEFGENHIYYILDLLQSKKLAEDIDKISNEKKDIKILINNAGITQDNLILRM